MAHLARVSTGIGAAVAVAALAFAGCDEGRGEGDDADDGGDSSGDGSYSSGSSSYSSGSSSESSGSESSGASGSDPCSTTVDMLVGEWITPEGRTVQSDAYNTLEISADGRGYLFMYSYGQSMDLHFAWRLEGDCDEVHYDYGEGWLADYSIITRLDSSKLAMQATDGSYYGEHTVYDRMGGGVPTDGTCRAPCTSSSDCEAGQGCLDQEGGAICLPVECETCWSENRSCYSDSETCAFAECGEVDPTASETCGEPCESAASCDSGEACLEGAAGHICVPPQCQGCWDAGQYCYWQASCGFDRCE